MTSWTEKAVFYHIYPLGFCDACNENTEEVKESHLILKVIDWIKHLKELGITAIYFGPLFESVNHGYDTVDYYKIDKRLGTNEDFKEVCKRLHEADIKIVLDGVFNHVGRDFFAFKDVQQKREASIYKDWFVNINFGADSPYHDGFSYGGWEGYYNLVKLNLWHPEVRKYLFGAVETWIKEFDIDGLRLDVAYCMDEDFLANLRQFTDSQKDDFWLMGEMIHGDYNRLLKPGLLHSVTNYECYKGIYSSHNDKNYFEINYSMNRLFGKGGIYQNKCLYNFVDNHDVNRIASTLSEPKCIFNVYTLLFTMPGVPSIYYGGEWQIQGKKQNGSDAALRPCLELETMQQEDSTLAVHIKKLSDIKQKYSALANGIYEQVVVKNEQLIFARTNDQETVYTALNLADHSAEMSFKVKGNVDKLYELLKDQTFELTNGECHIQLEPFEGMVLAEYK